MMNSDEQVWNSETLISKDIDKQNMRKTQATHRGSKADHQRQLRRIHTSIIMALLSCPSLESVSFPTNKNSKCNTTSWQWHHFDEKNSDRHKRRIKKRYVATMIAKTTICTDPDVISIKGTRMASVCFCSCLCLSKCFRFFAAKCITELQRMQNTRFAGLCVPKLRQNNNETSKIDLFWDVVGGQGVGSANRGATKGGQKCSELNFTLVKYPSEAGFSCLKMEAILRFDGRRYPFKFVFIKIRKNIEAGWYSKRSQQREFEQGILGRKKEGANDKITGPTETGSQKSLLPRLSATRHFFMRCTNNSKGRVKL